MNNSWKVTLPCTRAEAEALTDDMGALADMSVPPVLMTSEIEEDNPQRWQVDAYFEGKPSRQAIAALRALVPGSADIQPQIEKLPDEYWLTMSLSSQSSSKTVKNFHFLRCHMSRCRRYAIF